MDFLWMLIALYQTENWEWAIGTHTWSQRKFNRKAVAEGRNLTLISKPLGELFKSLLTQDGVTMLGWSSTWTTFGMSLHFSPVSDIWGSLKAWTTPVLQIPSVSFGLENSESALLSFKLFWFLCTSVSLVSTGHSRFFPR